MITKLKKKKKLNKYQCFIFLLNSNKLKKNFCILNKTKTKYIKFIKNYIWKKQKTKLIMIDRLINIKLLVQFGCICTKCIKYIDICINLKIYYVMFLKKYI